MTIQQGDGAHAWQSSPNQTFNRRPLMDADAKLALLDDDNAYLAQLSDGLGEHGFGVVSFNSGPALLDYFDEGGKADCMVLDWRLDRGSGLDVLMRARRRGLTTPAVFFTGLPATDYETVALDSGAADFVDKSRGVDILARRIRLIIESGKVGDGGAVEEEVRVGRLRLRPQVCRAYWDGTDVNLTVTEFRIVMTLGSSAGEYVGYRAIYDCVHSAGFIAGSGEDGYRTNVRSSMKRIRNKFRAIDDAFNEIENFPAFGYRWQGNASGDRSQ
jgi:two-component system response regulator ChvI